MHTLFGCWAAFILGLLSMSGLGSIATESARIEAIGNGSRKKAAKPISKLNSTEKKLESIATPKKTRKPRTCHDAFDIEKLLQKMVPLLHEKQAWDWSGVSYAKLSRSCGPCRISLNGHAPVLKLFLQECPTAFPILEMVRDFVIRLAAVNPKVFSDVPSDWRLLDHKENLIKSLVIGRSCCGTSPT